MATMAERLAAAASGQQTETSGYNGQTAPSIPQVETVDSESVAGKSKSGSK